MAESTSKVADSTPEVEQHVSESTPAPAPAIEELKEQGLKTEVSERKYLKFLPRIHTLYCETYCPSPEVCD